jgi:beta-alanine degradation protein BauB
VIFLIETEQTNLDPLTAAPNVYKLLNENDHMRVFRVVFQPHDVAKMHHHPEHMIYVLKGGKARLTSNGKTQDMDLNEGSVVFLEAQDHEAENISNGVIDLLVVELKE